MGSSWSSTFSTPGNQQTKVILNTILTQLVKDIDMHDLYALADPKKCREYIVVATSALEKLFAHIRLDKGKDGTLFFQSIRGIVEKNPNPAEQQQRCKELAFFFIRIFQVYAAVTLSIMDSELPATDPMEIVRSRLPARRGVVFIKPQGIKGLPVQQRGWLPGQWRGGALYPDRNGPTGGNFYLDPARSGTYQLLNRFLVAPQDRASADNLYFKDYSTMSITQDTLYDLDASGVRTAKNFVGGPAVMPRIFYVTHRDEEATTLDGNLKLIDQGTKFLVKLEDVKLNGSGGTSVEKELGFYTGDRNPKSREGRELPYVLHSMFVEAHELIAPRAFSATEFLKRFNLIRSDDGIVPIEGTHISVINPKDTKGGILKIIYRDKKKLGDDRTRDVIINVDLIVEKRKKIISEPQKYFVKLDFNTLETTPRELKEWLHIRGDDDDHFRGRQQYFTTGTADTSRPVTDKGISLPLYLETIFSKLFSSMEVDELGSRDGIRYTRAGLPIPVDSAQIPPEMRIKGIWEALAKDPPVKAHCVARAVQLLNVAAIRGNESKDAFSSICRVKFGYAKDGSLPPAGQSITEEYGIFALAMLFVDKLVAGSPQITQSDRFKDFRKKFKFFFERYEQSQLETIEAPEKLAGVTEKLMPGLCEGHTKDRIKVDGSTLGALRSKAQQLLSRQASHVQNSMAILFKLFDQKTVVSGGFALSSYVERNGMEAVNKIAEETRNMLMEYYGDCEKTYKDGLYILYNKYKANPDSIQYSQVDDGAQADPIQRERRQQEEYNDEEDDRQRRRGFFW